MKAISDLGGRNTQDECCNIVIRRTLFVSCYNTEVMLDLEEEGGGGGRREVILCRSLAMQNQEVSLLTETDHQIFILKCRLERMSDSISHFSNRPGYLLGHHLMRSAAMVHGNQQKNITVQIVAFPYCR